MLDVEFTGVFSTEVNFDMVIVYSATVDLARVVGMCLSKRDAYMHGISTYGTRATGYGSVCSSVLGHGHAQEEEVQARLRLGRLLHRSLCRQDRIPCKLQEDLARLVAQNCGRITSSPC